MNNNNTGTEPRFLDFEGSSFKEGTFLYGHRNPIGIFIGKLHYNDGNWTVNGIGNDGTEESVSVSEFSMLKKYNPNTDGPANYPRTPKKLTSSSGTEPIVPNTPSLPSAEEVLKKQSSEGAYVWPPINEPVYKKKTVLSAMHEYAAPLLEQIKQLQEDYDTLHRLKEEWKDACYTARQENEQLEQQLQSLKAEEKRLREEIAHLSNPNRSNQ